MNSVKVLKTYIMSNYIKRKKTNNDQLLKIYNIKRYHNAWMLKLIIVVLY